VGVQGYTLQRGKGREMVLEKVLAIELQFHACEVLCVLLRLLHKKFWGAGA